MAPIINALTGALGPWQVVALASVAALGYSLKQLLQWPRPAEVDRLHQANVNLRAQIKEQRATIEKIDDKRETIRIEKLRLELGASGGESV